MHEAPIRRGCDFSRTATVTTDGGVQADKLLVHHWSPRWWGAHASRSLFVPNAGGHSVISEAVSIEYMRRTRAALTVALEMEVGYKWSNWAMVDYCARIGGREWVGVSVTRATGFPRACDFDRESADRLLRKKLYGLIVARRGISKRHGYKRSILHVIAESEGAVEHLCEAAPPILKELDIVKHCEVVVTLIDGGAHDDTVVVEAADGIVLSKEKKTKAIWSTVFRETVPDVQAFAEDAAEEHRP
eukprot:g6431.t1